MEYRVDYGELAKAANLAQRIADRSPSALSRMRLDLVSAAIPGSVSAGRAVAADSGLVDAARKITADLTTYAGALAGTAESYRVTEDTAEGAIQEFFGGAT